MTFGWQGTGKRALEFPDGAPVAPFVGLAPDGRGRIRYNRALNQFEQSLSGGPYIPFGAGGDDELVKVSRNDTTADYLNGKLVAGPGVTLTELNDGGDESLRVSADGGGPSSIIEEFSPLAFSKLGGPGATDGVVGSTDIPAVLLTASTQLLSTRVAVASGWDSSSDVTVSFAVATDGAVLDGETLTFDVDYIYARSGTAALADLNKAVTTIAPALTVTTAEGLIDETVYRLDFTLDRNDATNPYAGETTGGFGIRLNLAAASVISSIHIIGMFLEFPI